MKILMITPFPPDGIGGAETFIKELIKESSRHHEVDICTMKPRKKAWKGIGLMNFFSTFPIMLIKTIRMCMTKKYEILHAQGLISGLVAILLKKIFKVKVYLTLLALYDFTASRIFNRLCGYVFQNIDIIFVEGKNGFINIAPFVDSKKIRVFNHWVDQETFCPPKERSYDKIRILFIGRPILEKGRHIVEEAERIINKPEKYEFIYVNNAPHEELPKYYQMAHIVVVPSLYAEGYCRVVAEASSCGCALIVSKYGSLPEMVACWGIVFDGTAKDLVRWLENVVLEIDMKDALDYAKENFSSKNAEAFLNEYN